MEIVRVRAKVIVIIAIIVIIVIIVVIVVVIVVIIIPFFVQNATNEKDLPTQSCVTYTVLPTGNVPTHNFLIRVTNERTFNNNLLIFQLLFFCL